MVFALILFIQEGYVNRSGINKESFREKLLKLSNELLQVEKRGNESARTVELDQSRVGRLSRMDALQAQAVSIESRRRRNLSMQRIESALKRIDKDEFGFCIHCEEEIDLKRLEFDPTALLCIDCAHKAEK
jgi:DnaK suppressor protein